MKKDQAPPESTAQAAPTKPASTSAQDVVLVHGVTEDKKGLRVLRAREHALEFGEVRPLQEGQPINGDVVCLRPRPQTPYICDVETTYSPPRPVARAAISRRPTQAGPAQVASQTYRDNWDAIWATRTKEPDPSALN